MIQWRKTRRTQKKESRSDRATYLPHPSVLAPLRPERCWKPARISTSTFLSFSLRGVPRALSAGLSARQRGGDGGSVRAVSRLVFRGWRRCGGRCMCEAPGPAWLCCPGPRFSSFSSYFPARFAPVQHEVHVLRRWREFLGSGGTHMDKLRVKGRFYSSSAACFCVEDLF